jgi:hypothetical protein
LLSFYGLLQSRREQQKEKRGGTNDKQISDSDIALVVDSPSRCCVVGVSRASTELFCLVGTRKS